jgi:hypothetical protein
MPVNYYPQKTEDELLTTLGALQKRTGEGLVNFSTVMGMQQSLGYNGSSRVEVEIRRVLFSLHLLNPNTYADPYAARIRKTRTNYTFS